MKMQDESGESIRILLSQRVPPTMKLTVGTDNTSMVWHIQVFSHGSARGFTVSDTLFWSHGRLAEMYALVDECVNGLLRDKYKDAEEPKMILAPPCLTVEQKLIRDLLAAGGEMVKLINPDLYKRAKKFVDEL